MGDWTADADSGAPPTQPAAWLKPTIPIESRNPISGSPSPKRQAAWLSSPRNCAIVTPSHYRADIVRQNLAASP
jgi:hypothetical protein